MSIYFRGCCDSGGQREAGGGTFVCASLHAQGDLVFTLYTQDFDLNCLADLDKRVDVLDEAA